MEKAIVVKKLTKKYKMYQSGKERLFDFISPKEHGKDFYALSEVDFEANRGEVVGFVGINGSGKSTLSNIIAGIVPETSGTISINGAVSIIAVAAGLKNDLSGRENIELKLLMLGFSKREIKAIEEEIIAFAELEDFIDQPVKSYSSGMKSRLGFSISVNINPDILIIDEALSVGDKTFAEKSLEKMNEFKDAGKTMIFVSHSIGQMKKFCDKILWLEFGKVKDYGDVDIILPKYERFLRLWRQLSREERIKYKESTSERHFSFETFIQRDDIEISQYQEKYISRIGRIKPDESHIYKSLKNIKEFESSKKYQKYSLYIKMIAIVNKERYYLLSDQPSTVQGVIGWINEKNVNSHELLFIEQESRTFQVLGEGYAYDRPWGASRNVILDLNTVIGMPFHVERTDKVRKGCWYYGRLNNKQVWIHENRVLK